jgi:predicted RecA/RadA family phage recombinase
MKNWRQAGKVLDYTNDTGADIASGSVVVIGSILGVASGLIAAGEIGDVAVEEVFALPKKQEVLTAGDEVWWDAEGDPYDGVVGSGALTKKSYGNVFAGMVTEDAGETNTTAYVKLQAMRNIGMRPVEIPLLSAIEADGTLLAAFSDGDSTTPGIAVANSKALGIRWNNHATPDPIMVSVPIPADRKADDDLVIHVLASKTGATVGDAVTFAVGAFFLVPDALHDADADCGGTTSAMDGDAAAKTVQEVTLTIDAADIPTDDGVLTLTLQPTDGTLGTDDVIVERAWITS